MKLAKREKLFVTSLGVIIGIILILQLIVFPFFENKNRLKKQTTTLGNLIKEMNSLNIGGQDINKISGNLERVVSGRKESLDTLVYRELEAVGIRKQNITGMDPREGEKTGEYQEVTVELRLNTITLPQLREFLKRIERPEKYIFVKMAIIEDKQREEGYLNATVRIMSYKKINP